MEARNTGSVMTSDERTILPALLSVLLDLSESNRQFIYGYSTAIREEELHKKLVNSA